MRKYVILKTKNFIYTNYFYQQISSVILQEGIKARYKKMQKLDIIIDPC